MNFKKYIFLLAILVFFGSCSYKKPKLYFLTEKKKKYSAVIIFLKNETKNKVIQRIIYRILTSRLINSPIFSVVEEGEVRNFFIREEIYPGSIPSYLKLKKLKEKTDADIIIGGNILNADDRSGDVKITLTLWARDIKSGKLLWTTYYVKTGEDYRKIFHFGRVFSLSELADKMLNDIVSSWENNLK